ncbi:hypothetical protein [Saccharospirillum impatiens]|uniref:hypothetical protein n=1 Tax=Saccharospirillum impatiens TaxID=169438 RepID=UPI00048BC221|nr:hypothetical protein [Saccharospirillum impatiens]
MSDRPYLLSKASILAISLTAFLLAACGPESNSRYGDQYWDPWDTKETFDPIDAPEFSVEFYRTSDEGVDPEVYEARITLDASETYERLYGGAYSWGFLRGNKERETLTPLGATSDLQLVYAEDSDDPNSDERLRATIPGDYRIFMVGETEGPLGKITVRFDDMRFSLPGCQTTFEYYEDNIDDTLEDCAECHQRVRADEEDPFQPGDYLRLPTNDFNVRRRNFLEHVDTRIDESNLSLPNWIVNPSHPGDGTITENSVAYENIAEFITMLEAIKSENNTISSANNSGGDTIPEDFCVTKPADFAFTVEE